MAIAELGSTHPYLCKRAAAIREYAMPGSVREVGRTPLAYPFAPLFGAFARGPMSGGGSMLTTVLVVGVLAVFAIQAARRNEATGRAGGARARSASPWGVQSP
jgi:hypothetical protein